MNTVWLVMTQVKLAVGQWPLPAPKRTPEARQAAEAETMETAEAGGA